MANGVDRVVAAFQAASSAWRSYGAPFAGSSAGDAGRRRARFALLAALYAGEGYAGEIGRRYREAEELYAPTRQIVNYVKVLCDFWAGHIYPGPISPDGQRTVEGMDAALPLVTLVKGGDAAETALRAAFGQLSSDWWAWGQWLPHRIRQTEILGTTLTEIVDEPASGKLALQTVWPGVVDEITLDAIGNVKGYALEYRVTERGALDPRTGRRKDERIYLYRKVVDGKNFLHYVDDRLDEERSGTNLYGFVPAVWDRALLGWGDWGEPAIHGSQAASDELNELWSHADDRLHQMFAMPVLVSGGGSTDKTYGEATRTRINVLGVQNAGQISAVQFSLGDVSLVLDKINDAIALENPEVRLYERLREMSQVSRPGIQLATADVAHRLNDRAARYDRPTISLLQMGTAVAAMRLANGTGGWSEPTEQQRKFEPFGLDSYKAGALDCMMLPRELVKPTLLERITEQQTLETLQEAESLRALGLDDAAITARLDERTQRANADAQRQDAALTAQMARFAQGDSGTGPNANDTQSEGG